MAMRNSTLRWMLLDLHEQYKIEAEKSERTDLNMGLRAHFTAVALGLQRAIEEIEIIWSKEED